LRWVVFICSDIKEQSFSEIGAVASDPAAGALQYLHLGLTERPIADDVCGMTAERNSQRRP
jgi:hypothetical protein